MCAAVPSDMGSERWLDRYRRYRAGEASARALPRPAGIVSGIYRTRVFIGRLFFAAAVGIFVFLRILCFAHMAKSRTHGVIQQKRYPGTEFPGQTFAGDLYRTSAADIWGAVGCVLDDGENMTGCPLRLHKREQTVFLLPENILDKNQMTKPVMKRYTAGFRYYSWLAGAVGVVALHSRI